MSTAPWPTTATRRQAAAHRGRRPPRAGRLAFAKNPLLPSNRPSRQRTTRRPDRERDRTRNSERRSNRSPVRIRSSLRSATVPVRARSTGPRRRAGPGDCERLHRLHGGRALDALVTLGARVKVSYEIARTRLHAKAWLFHRDSGLHTAYIGSSNLTHAAQVDGLEWNVRVSAAENPEVIERFAATFEQYWQEPEFEDYEPGRDAERLDRALARQGHGGRLRTTASISHCWSMSHRNLISPWRSKPSNRNAGTGIAAISSSPPPARARPGSRPSTSSVYERKARVILSSSSPTGIEILRQSLAQVFQLVLREPGFGERLVGGERPRSARHVYGLLPVTGKPRCRHRPRRLRCGHRRRVSGMRRRRGTTASRSG